VMYGTQKERSVIAHIYREVDRVMFYFFVVVENVDCGIIGRIFSLGKTVSLSSVCLSWIVAEMIKIQQFFFFF
jgi:hypothetical protein